MNKSVLNTHTWTQTPDVKIIKTKQMKKKNPKTNEKWENVPWWANQSVIVEKQTNICQERRFLILHEKTHFLCELNTTINSYYKCK